MSLLETLDYVLIRDHYDRRLKAHRRMLRLHDRQDFKAFADLALGITDAAGNFSADEHTLGPRVLAGNSHAAERIWDLANELRALDTAEDVPAVVHAAGLAYLKISVGSELACMMNPKVCWVANTRTIWTHLVLKHDWNTTYANQELRLYRLNDTESDMKYEMWKAVYVDMGPHLLRVVNESAEWADVDGVAPGDLTYLWADAIADGLYGTYAS